MEKETTLITPTSYPIKDFLMRSSHIDPKRRNANSHRLVDTSMQMSNMLGLTSHVIK
jgi:hypothetical protein